MPLNDLLDAVNSCLSACDPESGHDPHAPAVDGQWALRLLRAEVEAYRAERARAGGAARRILVAVDDSEPSVWAVRTAGRLAADLAADVALVHVVSDTVHLSGAYAFAASAAGPLVGEPPLISPAVAPVPSADRMAEGRKLLRLAQDELGLRSNVLRVVREGNPQAQIVEAAKDWGADLVLVGAHVRGRLARFLTGSTAEWVVRHAPCPVMVVAHDPAERERQAAAVGEAGHAEQHGVAAGG